MIDAAEFVEAARQHGFSLYCGVPCSYLKPFINYVIDDPELRYVSSSNEGDAKLGARQRGQPAQLAELGVPDPGAADRYAARRAWAGG